MSAPPAMKLYVVWVHGGGEQKPGESRDFEDRIRAAFQRAVRRAGRPKPPREALAWFEAYWAEITQDEEDLLRERLGMGGPFRRFVISNVGDAIAYSELPNAPSNYKRIQRRFAQTLRAVSRAAQETQAGKASLTVITHSLGTVIASDGIYDLQKSGQFPANLSFDHFVTLSALLALYSLRYTVDGFAQPVRPERAWLNFYYAPDLLGYPLKPLNEAYGQAVTRTVRLCVAGDTNPLMGIIHALVAWLPGIGHVWSHLWYFTDRTVIRDIARTLAERWIALQPPLQ